MLIATIRPWWLLPVLLAFALGCMKPPTLLQRSPKQGIPDGLTINVFTAKPPVAFQFRGGHLVPCPFIPNERISKKEPVPPIIRSKRRVADWLKVPQSDQIAVLTETERWGFWPLDLLAMLAGHPIPHNTFYLELYDAAGHLLLEKKCITGKYLSASIKWQTQAST